MGLFSNLRNNTDESESWVAHLMDDESIPLDDLIAPPPPPIAEEPADSAEEATTEPVDAWHFPDLDPPEGGSDMSFDAAPFDDDAAVDFDNSMLDLGPIGHEPNAFATVNAFGDLPDFSERQTPPSVFDRRSDEPVSVDADADADADEGDLAPIVEYLPTLEELHTGPVGPEAGAMLDAFGLADGASWIELRERFVTMVANCRPGDDAPLAMQTELAVLRREINSQYASLRLLAAP